MSEFIQVEVNTDAGSMVDQAVEALQARWPGWEPADGDLAYVLIQALALLAQDAAEVAARVPSSIFRKIGTDVYKVTYQAGEPATSTVEVVFADSDPHTIPAGTQLLLDDYVFATTTDVGPVTTSASGVEVEAAEPGTDANALTGTAVLLSALDWIDTVDLEAPTSGGTDPETDQEYLDRLAARLQLQATGVVTLRDYELFALDFDGVARAVAVKLNELTNPRDVTLFLADDDGLALSSGLKTEILAGLATARAVNATVAIDDPTYTEVDVEWTAAFEPGYDVAYTVAAVNAELEWFFDPRNYGADRLTPTRWVNRPTVYWTKVIGVIESVPGVDYVVSLEMNGASTDLSLSGAVPLTTVGTVTGAEA